VLGLPDTQNASRMPVPVRIGPGGLAPAVLLAGLFASFGARVGVPVAMAALLGGIGGTASLLVHELAHVAAARKSAGIRSAAVSLTWFGAATQFEGAYQTGRDQIRVAIAGPRASFALALGLFGECLLPGPPQLRLAVFLLAVFNVGLTVLNLVPAYPLDGHKLVVGLLWSWTGSEPKARRIIRRIGLGWMALELPGTVFLLVERPRIGVAVVLVGLTFLAQKRLLRKPAV
jgi:Zn-dependent protease